MPASDSPAPAEPIAPAPPEFGDIEPVDAPEVPAVEQSDTDNEPEPEMQPEPEPEMQPEPEPEMQPEPEPEMQPEPEPEQPAVGPRVCGCETPAGESGQVSQTIVVEAGQVYDGECQIFRANPGTLGNGSQDEGQSPVFRVNNGGTLKNVVLGASAADGVHLYGDVQLENIHWLDIGEDAMTVKEAGTVYLDCGSAADGDDKVFQVNAAAEIHISNFTARNAGKFMRQNGGTGFHVDVTIDHCDISQMDEVVFRTDSSTSFVSLTNTRYSDLGRGFFLFGDRVVNGASSQSEVSNNVEY
jgi:pectate lyase C